MKPDAQKNIDVTLGNRIRILRESKGLKLLTVADDLGFSESDLSRKERGMRSFSPEDIERFSEYYNVSLDYLYGKPESSGFDVKLRILCESELRNIFNALGKEEFCKLVQKFL